MSENKSEVLSKEVEIKLTQYSHGAGCGCKISPKVLDDILASETAVQHFPQLLVGNHSRDDAAVFDLADGSAIISTTDFFMPIVDDPFDFGRIASVNALSDVYAMGGTPLMAIAILGWPVDKIPAHIAQRVLEGSRHVCNEASIPLAGGHSIDSPEPIFGLAVTGKVNTAQLKKNDSATAGCTLFLTKPLGIGIVTTAQKRGLVKDEHFRAALQQMLTLNSLGEKLGRHSWVKALTDVTGFGLLGHLSEMCDGSGLSAEIDFEKVPRFGFLQEYLDAGCIPGGTNRNWDSYRSKISGVNEEQRKLLCDPQTSGGLLIAVENGYENALMELAAESGLDLQSFGKMVERRDYVILVK